MTPPPRVAAQPGRRRRSLGARLRRTTICALATAVLTNCYSAADRDGDPLVWFNRPMFAINTVLDDYLIWPVTSVYMSATPPPLQTGVSNVLDNASYPNVVLNDFLQGKVGQGFADLGRFAINTTLGLAGVLDVATPLGLEKHDEDLGQTLGAWGVGEIAYVVLPVFGPSTLRDVPDLPASTMTSILIFVRDPRVAVATTAMRGIDRRARAAGAMETIDETAADRYVFVREAYLQNRRFKIHDGNPPIPELDDENLLDENLLEGDPFADEPPGGTTSGRPRAKRAKAAPAPRTRPAPASPKHGHSGGRGA